MIGWVILVAFLVGYLAGEVVSTIRNWSVRAAARALLAAEPWQRRATEISRPKETELWDALRNALSR